MTKKSKAKAAAAAEAAHQAAREESLAHLAKAVDHAKNTPNLKPKHK